MLLSQPWFQNYVSITRSTLQETELENWLKLHTEYTPKQLSNLVTCGTGSHIGKKMKEKFLGLLNEIESPSVGKSNSVTSTDSK